MRPSAPGWGDTVRSVATRSASHRRPTDGPSASIAAGLDLGAARHGVLVFLPGFLVAPAAYRTLLTPIADAGYRVVVPRLYRRGPQVMTGRLSPPEEASRAAAVVAAVASAGLPCVLGGHSRGGFVAWLAASAVADGLTGLVLVDPVSGGGPPWAAPEPPETQPDAIRTLIIGAARGGRCAPAGRNHETFAAVAPDATHVVVPDCGHADVLDGAHARLGRRLCTGAADPARVRAEVAGLLLDFLVGGSRP